MIYLLDLNFTLVENSAERWRAINTVGMDTWVRDQERYRAWLIDLLRREHVVMVTARPERWQAQTLASIQARHQWQPGLALFKPDGCNLTPPALKRTLVEGAVFEAFGSDPAGYFALESNRETRKMYASIGIKALAIDPECPWFCLPGGARA